MRHLNSRALPLIAALLLAACGGGGDSVPVNGALALRPPASPPTFTSVVSFGDSLSDVGTYTPATLIPGTDPPIYLGGKFTTNGPTAKIWVEDVAATLGLVVTPAEMGFAGRSVRCPAAAQGLATTCTAYGQGGARVTDPNGIRHSAGALTVPIKTQIANHLASFGSFKPTDLVLVWAGANDLLWEVEPDAATNPDSFVVRLLQIEAQAQAGAITPERAQALILLARLASQAHMRTAALQLAGYIRTEVLAKGGKYVAILNLPDPVSTPEGAAKAALSPELGRALTAFSDTFNLWLREGLIGQPVQFVDIRGLIGDMVAHPGVYGMVNASVPACDADKMRVITGGAVTDGFALFCNATPQAPYNGIRDGADVNTWFFADGNHPTTGGYQVVSDAVIARLRSVGWLARQRGGAID